MNIIKKPARSTWAALCQRPETDTELLDRAVAGILATVKKEGDKALLHYTRKFDRATLSQMAVTREETDRAGQQVPEALQAAIAVAAANIETFHAAQARPTPKVTTTPGVVCWQQRVGIEKVGLYIPGGSAPLFSSVLMLGIPARLAGCREIILCTPPDKDGQIAPAILYTANLVGVTRIFKVGGAQAIAALAYGTETIPRVDKIFGPGNRFVTRAKELVQRHGTAIDMPAGPSEVLIIADDSGIPAFIAADLLAQAEHGPDSQVMLVATNKDILSKTIAAVNEQLPLLPRQEVARQALAGSRFVLFDTLDDCLAFSNAYAPEHLIVATRNPTSLTGKITHAGSVFLGHYSCESAGDYASGTNHTLPTNGYARSYSGVSLDSFVRQITFQELSPRGLQNLGPAIAQMAAAEGLLAHKNAVSIRLKTLKND